eukprot:scaffold2004_cov420-Prasinococcus_capsulatus_cf.AAC.2
MHTDLGALAGVLERLLQNLFELHLPVYLGEEGVVLSYANVLAGEVDPSSLTHDDSSRQYILGAKPLDAEILGIGIAPVGRHTSALLRRKAYRQVAQRRRQQLPYLAGVTRHGREEGHPDAGAAQRSFGPPVRARRDSPPGHPCAACDR